MKFEIMSGTVPYAKLHMSSSSNKHDLLPNCERQAGRGVAGKVSGSVSLHEQARLDP